MGIAAAQDGAPVNGTVASCPFLRDVNKKQRTRGERARVSPVILREAEGEKRLRASRKIPRTLGAEMQIQGVLKREPSRSEEHTSELQSHLNLVCRLLLEKKKKK